MDSGFYTFPASFAQQRLWFLDQLDPGQSVYNMLYAVSLEAEINIEALQQGLNEIVRRHESLRTTFSARDGQPVQVVASRSRLDLRVTDLRDLAENEKHSKARACSEREAKQPFDLSGGPLLRVNLLRLADDQNVLLICIHHIVSDGWSMDIFMQELAKLYQAFSEGRLSPLPEVPVQYADYAVWQREWLQGEALENQISFWREHLDGVPTSLELAADRSRPPVQTFRGARLHTTLPAILADRLRGFSRQEGVTLYMTLLATFGVLVWRYSGQDDLVVGTPIAGRNRSELESLIGFFANTLPLRMRLMGNPRFQDHLSRVRETALEAFEHQDVPFDRLVEELRPERSLSRTPLFQVLFALENTPGQPQKMSWLEVDRGTARCDLSLFISDKGGELSCMWEYSTDLFETTTIERMALHYRTLLESILDSPQERLAYLPSIAGKDKQQLLRECNVLCEPAAFGCLHKAFEAFAKETPDAPALSFAGQQISYQQLNERANQLAHYLGKRGIGPEVPVGICLERSAEMVIALLAVLKAGGAYVPLDPAYPASRLAFMLADSRSALMITQRHLQQRLPQAVPETVLLDVDWAEICKEDSETPQVGTTPQNLAYVIYTSGSTGKPKGVEVTHQTVLHLVTAAPTELGLRADDIWSVVHSNAFDFSVWEIWGCLCQGGQLVIVPFEVVQSPADLYQLLCRSQVTVLNQTPSSLRLLLAARRDALNSGQSDWSVRLIVCGGDALDQDLAVELSELDIPAWNFYGPTENSVWTTCTQIFSREPPHEQSNKAFAVSIGEPLADMQVYLLDGFLQPVPYGVAGELYIGGAGLARGYLNRPELTAERFIPNSFTSQPGERLYATGDLARYRQRGLLEFLGRIDQQVKLRGFRVELGEIEAALSKHDNVAEAVATIREDRPGDRRLVSYIVAKHGTRPTTNELRAFLHASLPDYMVPATFVFLEALPLTTNRKIARDALPAPDFLADRHEAFAAADTPVEEMLSNIWAAVLGLEAVGIYDNFFELGGHSLLATQVISRIRKAFHVDLPLRTLFEAPTVSAQSKKLRDLIQAEQGIEALPLVHLAAATDVKLPLSFAQQRLWFLDQLEPGSPFYNIARAIRLCGHLDLAGLRYAINEILRRHGSLRTVFGVDEEPFQRVTADRQIVIPRTDLDDLPYSIRDAEAVRVATEEIHRPFDLTSDPLLRCHLLKLSEDDYVLVLTMHHIAADGWSLSVLFNELEVLYDAFVRGEASPLAALPIQYSDFAVWQRRWLQGAVLERLLSYWKKQLTGATPVLELQPAKPRPKVQSFRGACEWLTMSSDLQKRLKALSRSEGATLFMTCLATFQLLLSRYSGQQDIVVGTDVANRNRAETEALIGFFTNLLPLRTTLFPDQTFTELLSQVRETALEAYAHQDLPFDKLVEELKPPRDLGGNPLVQVLIVMQNEVTKRLELPGVLVSRFGLPIESSRFDLVLFLSESVRGLDGLWLYNPDLFEGSTIAQMSLDYQKLLTAIVNDPSARLDTYEVFPKTEARQNKMEEKRKQVNQLRATRRRGVDLAQVSGVATEYLYPERKLPLVIKPQIAEVDLIDWTNHNREFIGKNLLQHGAILFRGFSVESVPEFERFASTICPDLFGEYGDLPREELGGKVYGSTPYPADETILFHNESSHMHRWPMLIWFYCVKAAEQRGESPIIDCRQVYQLMDPAIREEFERKGLMYVRNFTKELDVSWQSFFHTTDKTVVENYCRSAGIDFEWKGENDLRTRQVCPAIVKHPQTGEMVFFNQLQLHHISCLAPTVRESLLSMMAEDDLPRNVYYGDRTRIEDSVIQYLSELYQKLAARFPWIEQDILMLNNMLVAHSRKPYAGERKIVVALGNVVSKDQLYSSG